MYTSSAFLCQAYLLYRSQLKISKDRPSCGLSNQLASDSSAPGITRQDSPAPVLLIAKEYLFPTLMQSLEGRRLCCLPLHPQH